MNTAQHPLDEPVRVATLPTWAEIVRAKTAILDLLDDGEPHGVRTIQTLLLVADKIPLEINRDDKLQIATTADIESVVTPDHPILARMRLALAATEALIDLGSSGLVVPVANAPTHESTNPFINHDRASIPYQMAGMGSAVQLKPPLSQLASAYRLAPRHARSGIRPWFLDADLFSSDLDMLALHARGRRCLAEALASYRHGLHLACVNLLGATSEAAWYAAGEQLRHLDAQLSKALDEDNTTKVVTRVGETLRQARPLRTVADDLASTAALLRQLRNYGSHPRLEDASHLERYLSDASCAVLVMETHSYLTRLASAVGQRLRAEESQVPDSQDTGSSRRQITDIAD